MSERAESGQDVDGSWITREQRTLGRSSDSRVYVTDEGDCYPSVTTITDSRPNPEKQEDLKWWRRHHDGTGGTEHHSDIRKVTGWFGTVAHYALLSPFTDRELLTAEVEQARRELQAHGAYYGVDAWEWTQQRLPLVQTQFYRALFQGEITDVIAVERYVLDREIGYGGQYDLLYTREGPTGDETVLCDLKTGSNTSDENEMQLAAYANAVPIDVGQLKIIRSHPDNTHAKLDHTECEVRTDADFNEGRQHRFEQFRDAALALQRRISTVSHPSPKENPPSETSLSSGSEMTDGTSRQDTDPMTGDTKDEAEADEEESEAQDPIADAVDEYTGSPVGMGQQFRETVDRGEIPDMIEDRLGGVRPEDHDQVLERLDELLLVPTHANTAPRTEETSADSTGGSAKPSTRDLPAALRAEPIVETNGSSSVQVDLPSPLLALIDATIAHEDEDATSRANLIERALETHLAATIGTEVNQSHFERTERSEFSIVVDPVYKQLFALNAETDTTQDAEQAVRSAVYDELGIKSTTESIQVTEFDQYQFVVDTLVEAESCPCESRGEVVQAAVESHLGV